VSALGICHLIIRASTQAHNTCIFARPGDWILDEPEVKPAKYLRTAARIHAQDSSTDFGTDRVGLLCAICHCLSETGGSLVGGAGCIPLAATPSPPDFRLQFGAVQ